MSPNKKLGEGETVRINVLMSSEFYEQVKAAAKEMGLPVGTYVRLVLAQKLKEKR